MSHVAVFNDNIYPFKEVFREKKIEIPSKGHIMMERDEAYSFLGQMNTPVLDADGNHLPQGYKKLRILEKIPVEMKQEFKCQACANIYGDQTTLDTHIISQHVEILQDPTVIDKIKRPGRPKTKE